MKHYQDDPNFIGPRLPEDHPAYLAQCTDSIATITLATAPHEANATLVVCVSAQDLKAAVQSHGSQFPTRLAAAIRTIIPST